jgi:hypothetical protein
MTLELALAGLKARQENRAFQMLPDSPVHAVNERWPKDRAVIAFFQEAIISRAEAAIVDLARMPNVWDDSFVEFLISAVEAAASTREAQRLNGGLQERERRILSSGLDLLDRHYSAWSRSTTIAPRLSKAVLIAHPALAAVLENRQPGSMDFREAMFLLPRTHDRAMISVLRPLLANKTVIQGTAASTSRGVTPLRVSEDAANTISALLGEPPPFLFSNSGVGVRNPPPYPAWTEWDEKIAALEKRLDTLPE